MRNKSRGTPDIRRVLYYLRKEEHSLRSIVRDTRTEWLKTKELFGDSHKYMRIEEDNMALYCMKKLDYIRRVIYDIKRISEMIE